jgi:hypothetical protein
MKRSLILLLTCAILLSSHLIAAADGYSLKPGVQEYSLEPGEIKFGEISFKSNEKKSTEISATVETYDPKTGEILNKEPFVGLPEKEFTVAPGQQITIEYVISIPDETPVGSYFNIVTITEKRKGSNQSNNVSVKKAVGSIVAMHVIESEKSIEALFFDQSETSLKLLNRGLPFISKTELEYTYENKSNFVFRPEGEIRVLDQEGKQVAQRFEINPEKKPIYPGEKYSEKITLEEWETSEILHSKDVIARTYSGYGNNYITDKITVSLKYSIFAIGGTVGILLVALLAILIRFVVSRIRSKKS